MVAGAAAAASDILARIDAKGLISDSLQTVVSVANRVWTKDGGMTASELVKVLINCGSVVSFLDESGIQVGGSSDEVT